MTNLNSQREAARKAIEMRSFVNTEFDKLELYGLSPDILSFLKPRMTSLMIGAENNSMAIAHLVSTPGLGKTTSMDLIARSLGLDKGKCARIKASHLSGGNVALHHELHRYLTVPFDNESKEPHGLIIIDEAQRLATKDKDGKSTGNIKFLEGILDFLSCGNLPSTEYLLYTALSRFAEDVIYCGYTMKFLNQSFKDRDEVVDMNDPQSLDIRVIQVLSMINGYSPNYSSGVKLVATRLYINIKFLLERHGNLMTQEEFLELDAKQFYDLVQSLEGVVNPVVSYRRCLVVCLWNLDELYTETLQGVDCSLVDQISLLTGSIGFSTISKHLDLLFEPSQNSRFGQNWLPVRTFSSSQHNYVIQMELQKSASKFLTDYGINIEFKASVEEFVQRNGINPVHGFRPVLSCISSIEQSLSPLLADCLELVFENLDQVVTVNYCLESSSIQCCIKDTTFSSVLIGNNDMKHSAKQAPNQYLAINALSLASQVISYVDSTGICPHSMKTSTSDLGTNLLIPESIPNIRASKTLIMMELVAAQMLINTFGKEAPFFVSELVDKAQTQIIEMCANPAYQGSIDGFGIKKSSVDAITTIQDFLEDKAKAPKEIFGEIVLNVIRFSKIHQGTIEKLAVIIVNNHGVLTQSTLLDFLDEKDREIPCEIFGDGDVIGTDYLKVILGGENSDDPDSSWSSEVTPQMSSTFEKQWAYLEGVTSDE
jgi:hypothetical protein